jgi:hypothetical protein
MLMIDTVMEAEQGRVMNRQNRPLTDETRNQSKTVERGGGKTDDVLASDL